MTTRWNVLDVYFFTRGWVLYAVLRFTAVTRNKHNGSSPRFIASWSKFFNILTVGYYLCTYFQKLRSKFFSRHSQRNGITHNNGSLSCHNWSAVRHHDRHCSLILLRIRISTLYYNGSWSSQLPQKKMWKRSIVWKNFLTIRSDVNSFNYNIRCVPTPLLGPVYDHTLPPLSNTIAHSSKNKQAADVIEAKLHCLPVVVKF